MPIEPVTEILPRDIDDKGVTEVLNKFSVGIEQTVYFGTHVMKWCVNATKGAGEEVVPLLFSFRHALELLDSISILVRKSSIDPSKILLRAKLEVLLGTKYILQQDAIRRAMGFMVWHIHKKLKRYQRLDPETQQGKELRKKIEQDFLIKDMKITKPEQLDEMIANIEELLNEPANIEVEAEYQRFRRKSKSNPDWYSLFGGPSSIEQLAARVKMLGIYESLYRDFSGPTHGTDILEQIL